MFLKSTLGPHTGRNQGADVVAILKTSGTSVIRIPRPEDLIIERVLGLGTDHVVSISAVCVHCTRRGASVNQTRKGTDLFRSDLTLGPSDGDDRFLGTFWKERGAASVEGEGSDLTSLTGGPVCDLGDSHVL